MNNNADEILSNLWLGNELAAGDDDFIKLNKIQKIINISVDIPNYFYNIHYLRIPITNREKDIELFKSYLNYSYFFIDTALYLNRPILIHSSKNKDIALLLIIYYIMKKEKISFNKTLSKLSIISNKCLINKLYLKNAIIT